MVLLWILHGNNTGAAGLFVREYSIIVYWYVIWDAGPW